MRNLLVRLAAAASQAISFPQSTFRAFLFFSKKQPVYLLFAGLAGAASASAQCPPAFSVWYVNAAAPPGGTGTSWNCAYQNLQDAINTAVSGEEIWVASGTYLPTRDPFGNTTPADLRDRTFYLKNGVKIYGGFDGTEMQFSERDATANVTILSGDFNGDDLFSSSPGSMTLSNNTDNAYHVVLSVSDDNTTALDGFTIRGGNADGMASITVESQSIFQLYGAGVMSQNSMIDLSHCTILRNYASSGAGLCIAEAGMTLNQCHFSENKASNGAGVNNEANGSFSKCIFSGNLATNQGGAVRNAGNLTFTNCIVSGNHATAGAGIFNANAPATITNCSFSGNFSLGGGGGVYNSFASAISNVTNCIFYGNLYDFTDGYGGIANVAYSIVGEGHIGTGNSTLNPYFVNPVSYFSAPTTAADLTITACSPAVEAGTNAGAPADDIVGNLRPFGATVDLGAYEVQEAPYPPPGSIWYVDASAAAGGSGGSWFCAFRHLQDAIDAASSGHEIWVAAGTYLPTTDPNGNTDPDDPRDKTFYLKNGVKIFGGFAGTETTRSERNWATNVTTLSGDIGTANVSSDNCYHVLLSVSDASATELDGFTISDGNASGSGTLTVEARPIGQGFGGGMHNSSSSLTVSNCIFSGNSGSTGGGMGNNSASNPAIRNCVFAGNKATNLGGGMYNNSNSNPSVTNCTFSGNQSTNAGGAIYNITSSDVILKNCLIWNNRAAGVTGSGGSAITNIVSAPVITYSLIQNQNPPGTGNLNGTTHAAESNYPAFTTPLNPTNAPSTAGDFTLHSCSPVIDKGTTTGAPTTDLVQNGRVDNIFGGGTVDLGAYEFQTDTDADNDGYPNCSGQDCDDTDAARFFGNTEICDGKDNDCDDQIDDIPLCGAAGTRTWTGAYSTAWNVPCNWNPACVPTAADDVSIPNVANAPVISTAGAVAKSVLIQSSGLLTITSAGTLKIDGAADEGIMNRGTVQNSGTINIGSTSGTGDFGIQNFNVFNNLGTGVIHINRSTTAGLRNRSIGTFHNSGNLTIGNTQSVGTSGILNEGAFNNNACAEISMFAPLNNSSTFSNAGLFSITTSDVHINTGNFINSGILEYLQGSPIPNVINNEIALVPVIGGCLPTLSNVLALGNPVDFTIATNWYLNANLTQPAGTYNPASNVFTATNITPNVNTTVYFEITNTIAGCSRVIETKVLFIPSLMAHCQNITVPIDVNGSVTVNASQLNDNSTGCGSLTCLINGEPSQPFTCTHIGNQTVTLTVSDLYNVASCTATVTVSDLTPPTFTNYNANINVGCNTAPVVPVPDAVDNCTGTPTVVQISGPPSGSPIPLGTTNLIYKATDASGNTSTCQVSLHAADGVPPTVVCKNATVNLSAAGTGSITTASVFASGSDNCGTVNLVDVTPYSFDCDDLGENTVMLTVNDGNGSSATCSATVTVSDVTLPTVSCKPTSVVLGAGGTGSITMSSVFDSGSDNCGVVNLVGVSPNAFTCNNLGTNTVTLTVNDGQGNTATCLATVTVSDLTPPTFTNYNANINVGCNTAPVVPVPDAVDNCTGTPTVVQISGPPSGSPIPLGTTNLIYKATDASGNTSTCQVSLHAADGVPPTVVCKNATVNLSAAGTGSITTASVFASGSDNCGTVNLVDVTPYSFDCDDLGENTVMLTVDDGNGSSATCSATVTVSDVTLPTVSCKPTSVVLNASGTGSITMSSVFDSGSDNCGVVNLVGVSPNAFTCNNLGTNTVTLTVNDGHGNNASCTATVTVSDPNSYCCAKPDAICKNATAVLVVNIATITVANVDNGSTAHCGLQSSIVWPNTFNCSHVGTPQTVTLTVTDLNGASDQCQATVTVLDQTAPGISCPANITKMTDPGQCSAVTTYALTASDNCSYTLTQTNGLPSGAAFPKGIHVINWKATDPGGNTAICSFMVTVNDGQLPVIVCPGNISKTTDAGQCTAVVTYANPTFSDNCPQATLTRSSGPESGSAFPKGATMVNWKATDAAGNSSLCGFTVTVTDGQLPTITCPANIVKNADAGQCNAIVTYANPTYSDNCAGAGLDHISGGLSGSWFQKGVHSIIWQATEAAGGTKRCTFTITVNDNQAPAITCPSNQTKNTDAGQCTAVATYPAPVYSDNCTGGSAALVSGLASGAAFPKGVNTVTWRATDAAGLTRTCTFRITVNDTEAPVITCPPNQSKTTAPGLCTAVASYNLATFTDNCTGGSVIKQSGLNSGSAFPQGVNQVVFKATDAAGTQSLCTMTVTVTDPQLPTVTCSANIVVTGSITSGVCNATVTYTHPTATDNCGILSNYLLSGLASGSVFPLGTTTNTWKATDHGGLTATCAFTVSVGCGTSSQGTMNGEPGAMNDERGTMNDESRTSNYEPATSSEARSGQSSFIVHRLSFNLAPNPATTEVQITVEGMDERGGILTVFDAQGRVVWQQALQGAGAALIQEIRVSDFQAGLYQVRLQTATEMVTKAMVVME